MPCEAMYRGRLYVQVKSNSGDAVMAACLVVLGRSWVCCLVNQQQRKQADLRVTAADFFLGVRCTRGKPRTRTGQARQKSRCPASCDK